MKFSFYYVCNKTKIIKTIILFVFLFQSILHSQSIKTSTNVEFNSITIDNMLAKTNLSDTNEINTVLGLGFKLLVSGEPKKALKFYRITLANSKRLGFKKGEIKSLLNHAAIYNSTGFYDSAFYYLAKAKPVCSLNYNGYYLANYYKGMANGFLYTLNRDSTVYYFIKALKITENRKDTLEFSNLYLELAAQYQNTGDKKNVMMYLDKALYFKKLIKDNTGFCIALMSKGDIYLNLENYYPLAETNLDSALHYYFKAQTISQPLNDIDILIRLKMGIATIFSRKGNKNESLKYHTEIADLCLKINDRPNYIGTLNNIASIYYDLKRKDEALRFATKAYDYAKETNFMPGIKTSLDIINVIYESNNDYKNAYLNYKLGMSYYDSLQKKQNTENYNKQLVTYETEKKNLEIDVLNKEKIISGNKIEKQKQFNIIVVISLLFAVVFLIFVFYNLKQKNKYTKNLQSTNNLLETQKTEIASQNLLLETKNQQITDSINYAKKIQDSMLPNQKKLANYFADWFIFYQPKDIVSGDFYWMLETDNGIIVALADCTGHGVPGALMSVLGHNSLDSAYGEQTNLSPANVLRYLDNFIKQKTKTDEDFSSNVDGMALSLFSYNKRSKSIIYACAKQPLYVVRNNELIELKSNSFSIGSLQNQTVFEDEFKLETNDCIYLFSDGYPDQKGGLANRKFMTPKLKELFISISNKPCQQQQSILKTTMEEWKGTNSQIDDMLVIGLRV